VRPHSESIYHLAWYVLNNWFYICITKAFPHLFKLNKSSNLQESILHNMLRPEALYFWRRFFLDCFFSPSFLSCVVWSGLVFVRHSLVFTLQTPTLVFLCSCVVNFFFLLDMLYLSVNFLSIFSWPDGRCRCVLRSALCRHRLLSRVFVSVYVFFFFSNNFSSPPSSYGSSDSVAGSLLAANRFFVPYFCMKRYQIRFSCFRNKGLCSWVKAFDCCDAGGGAHMQG